MFVALQAVFCQTASAAPYSTYTGPQITVVPWNGAQSAVSLTFDDGLDSQLDLAVPALDAKGMKATFFITETALKGRRVADWKKLILDGHEIGNHSKHHYQPSDTPTQSHQRTYDDTLGRDESVGAQQEIEQAMGTSVVSYAYPYCANDPHLVKYLPDTHLSARGGWGKDGTYFMKPSYAPDWMNLPTQFTSKDGRFDTDYKGWVDRAISEGAWTVITVHGVGDASTTLPLDQMNLLFNYLDAHRSNIWIAPYGTVSGYWRAQKIVEDLTPKATATGTSYAWDVPACFRHPINLKVKIRNGEGYRLVQKGVTLQPDADGTYTISFGAKALELIKK